MQKIVVASDHAGFELKEKLKKYLASKGFAVTDVGTFSSQRCDYPDFAYALGREVSSGRIKRGVLICKSGIGDSIVANKLPGVRAALCYNIPSAVLSRQHNDSNVLVLGSAFVPERTAKKMLDIWFATPFEGGRHRRRLAKIKKIEEKLGIRVPASEK